ncbi:hypothetical protein FQA39_LY05897 [Lamprigera yunnana]|nr:hypothetical protein FQA39_LY05897 [Lamprigera yunnana]
MRMPLNKWNVFFICVGLTLTIVGIALLATRNLTHEGLLKFALRFGPGTTAYEVWQKPPDPITMDIYFFNWTNPEDIDDPSIKPKFVEMGPYRYKHFKEKTNISWNDNNDTVTYTYLKYFYFDENSPRHFSDVITTINMVPLTTAHISNDWNLIVQTFITAPVRNASVYIRKTVKELMFDGYEDPVLSVLNSLPFLTDPDNNRFGWFYGRNGTVGTDGVFNMKTTDGDEFATLQNWNYQNDTKFFKGHCGKVHGSAGEMYPKNLKPTFIHLFSAEMCRTAKLNFVKNVTIKGIPGYKFSPGMEVFDNGSTLQRNVCYDNSFPSGLLNVSSCKDHSPTYLSLPHFYYADPLYLNIIEGLHPEQKKHELYVTLEPNTGIIIDLAARMQINVQLQPLPHFGNFANLPNLILPVLWFDQQVAASDELVSTLNLLFQLPSIIEIISALIVAMGVSCTIGVILYVKYIEMKNQKLRMIEKEEIPLNTTKS